MTFPMTPEKFAALKEQLAGQKVTITPNSPTSGQLENSDVTLSYSYDGTSTLLVGILKRHSIEAKIAPDGMIYKRIGELLGLDTVS